MNVFSLKPKQLHMLLLLNMLLLSRSRQVLPNNKGGRGRTLHHHGGSGRATGHGGPQVAVTGRLTAHLQAQALGKEKVHHKCHKLHLRMLLGRRRGVSGGASGAAIAQWKSPSGPDLMHWQLSVATTPSMLHQAGTLSSTHRRPGSRCWTITSLTPRRLVKNPSFGQPLKFLKGI